MAQESGDAYEDHLVAELGGSGGFKSGKRQLDGKFTDGDVEYWYEAKSGAYWNVILANPQRLVRFKSVAGEAMNIARENGATYMMVSQNAIPDEITAWLAKKGIPWRVVP